MINAKEQIMKCGNVFMGKLLDTTNEKYKEFESEIRRCGIGDCLFMIREDGHWIKTSEIEDLKYSGNKIYVITLNSMYTLEYISNIEC